MQSRTTALRKTIAAANAAEVGKITSNLTIISDGSYLAEDSTTDEKETTE
ncbi:MAG: hypothetical protein LUH05_03270 [Candidatus Gastranaerophilales bacterium]|nr:hypothetical protein [Candidatus Gastranaerophilales bacterium]